MGRFSRSSRARDSTLSMRLHRIARCSSRGNCAEIASTVWAFQRRHGETLPWQVDQGLIYYNYRYQSLGFRLIQMMTFETCCCAVDTVVGVREASAAQMSAATVMIEDCGANARWSRILVSAARASNYRRSSGTRDGHAGAPTWS
eukprot:6175181-Pleurochrysis_carterae.AAC.9